jgi:ATP-dependent DNA ligase
VPHLQAKGREMKQEAAANFSFVEPMQALPVNDLPAGGWLYEMKFDWYRALAFKAGKEVRLFSRNRTNFNDNYPQLVDALKSLRAKDFRPGCQRVTKKVKKSSRSASIGL